jgi:acetyl esterase/lipase
LGSSIIEQAEHDVMFRVEHLPQAAALYLGTTEARTPLASPLFADLAGLPPLAVFASRVEVLRSDSERLHERARAAGVDCSLTLEASLPHAWPVMVALPEARATLRAAGAFITARTSGTHPG